MPDNTILFSVTLPDGTKTTLNETQYAQAQDKLFAKFPDAQVARVSSYVADDNDVADSDNYQIQLSDGTNTVLNSTQFAGNRDKIMEKFPDAQIAKISDMSDRYWRPKLDEAQAALEKFNGEHGSVINKYELYQNTIENNTPSQIAWQAEHEQEYRGLIKQRDALRDAVVNNPIVKRGRRQAQEQAMAARENYLDLASKATSGAERRDYKRAAKLQGDAAELFGAPGQYDKTDKNGFAQYMSDYGKGAINTFSDRDFWTRGITQIARDIDLHGIRKKVEEAEKAKGAPLEEGDFDRIITPSEKAQLFSFYNLARAQAERANDLSSAYKAGTSAAESLGYMAEFIISTGLGNVAGKALSASANGFARWMGQALMSEKALTRAVAQGVTTIPEMSRLAKVGTEIARPVIQGLWHTGTQLSTLSNMARMMNETNDKGELNSVGQGIWLGFADSLVENWSESFGNTIDLGMDALGKGLGWAGNKALGKTTFGQMARYALHSPFAQTLKEAGFNGFFGEMMEEWAGNAVRLATGLMDKDEFKQFASVQQQLEMAASFAPMSLFGLAGNMVSGAKYKKEYDKLSPKVKDILLKNNPDATAQAAINELFERKWATSEDIAAGLAPYAQQVLNSGSSTAKADYKTILDFARMAGANAFNDAVTEYQNEQNRNAMRETLTAQIGREFWQNYDSPQARDADGNPVQIQQVRVVDFADGSRRYIIGGMSTLTDGQSMNREYLTIDENGRANYITDNDIQQGMEDGTITSDREMMLDDYLQERVDASQKTEESKRMQQELQTKLAAVKARIAQQPIFDMGTPESPRMATVTEVFPEGVNVTYDMDGTQLTSTLSWKEVGDYIGMPITAQTDAQIAEEAAYAQQQAEQRKTKYNQINPGTPITVTMPGAEGDEQVQYRFAKAIYDENEGFVRIYVADENGNVMTDQKGNEVWFPEDMVQGLDALAEQSQQPAAAPESGEEETPETPEEAPVAPVSRYTNEAGKVNQTAFMKNEPEEWAKWNDERRQDGGANSKERLAAAIGELDKEISDLNKKKAATANPDDADALEEKVNGLAERHARLKAIYDRYIAVENAMREAENAARRAEFEKQAAAKKELEAKKQADLQQNISDDAQFQQIQKDFAAAKKVQGDEDTLIFGGQEFTGHYYIVEAETPTASHKATEGWVPTPGFPRDETGRSLNTRDYEHEPESQQHVMRTASEYDSRAMQHMVVVTSDGIVISGNERTMASQIAAQQNTDGKYIDYLKKHPNKYGFTAEQVEGFQHPRVIFVPDAPVPYTAKLFDLFNKSEEKRQNTVATAAKVAKITDDALVMRIADLFYDVDDINAVYQNPQMVNTLLGILESAGVMSREDRPMYVDQEGKLTGAGEDFIESVLFGSIFSSSDQAVRDAMQDKSIRRAVAFAFPTLVRIRNLSGEYSIIREMTDAVSLLARAKAANKGKAEGAIADYMNQFSLFSEGLPVERATVQLLAEVLNDKKYGTLRAVLNQYIGRAEAADSGQMEMFSGEVEAKEQILRDVLAANNINIDTYDNTQSGVPENAQVPDAAPEQGGGGSAAEPAGAGGAATEQGEGSSVDLLAVAKEQAKKNRKLQKILKRVDKWKKFLGNAFEVATGIEDVMKIEDAATRQQILDQINAGKVVEGWFANGKAVIYLPNIPDQRTLDRKVMHEVISHRGLKGLFEAKGKGEWDKFCQQVWDNLMTDKARALFINYPGVNGNQKAAADEFLAHCAENETAVIAQLDENFWTRLAEALKNFVNDAMGEDVFNTEDGWFAQLLKDATASVQQGTAAEQGNSGARLSVSENYSIPRERISQNLDQNNSPFILNSRGSEEFGTITASQNLPAAPIKLSLGDADNGLVHIENRHGKDIRNAGYDDVLSFIEYVAENFTDIREGSAYENEQGGENQSYLIQLTDEHNNTLFVQLSRDGKYWNINSAGVFAKKYGKRKKSIWSASSQQIGSSATSGSALQSEPNTDDGSTSKGTAPNVSGNKGSESSSNSQVSDIKNDEQEGTVLFSVKGKKGEKSLIGIHNISARKLASAVKTGGLANPSMAVIDLSFQKHEDFGEISLIAPSSLIDSETGRNAGTYTGDAWTPTYPGVSKQMSDKGWDKFFDDVRPLPYPFDADTRNDWREYLEDDRMGRSLRWWFLQDTGRNPEIIHHSVNLSDADREVFKSLEGKSRHSDVLLDEELWPKVVDLYKRLGDPAEVERAQQKVPMKEGRGRFTEYLEARNREVDDWGIWTSPVFDLVERLQRELRREGQVAEIATYQAADKFIEDNNLQDAFDQWLQAKEKEYGVKSVLFAGWTRDGDRKYVPNTVENASRLMNQEPEQNSYGNGGVNATRSLLLDRMESLSEIRKNRGLLGAFEGDASETDEYKEATDNWFNVIYTLAGMKKVDDNQFINIDIAESRLQEAIQQRDPIAYLNWEYRYHLDKDGEFAEDLKASLKEIKALPAKYFETKFNRPVYLNEFAAAVVPSDTRADVRKELEKAGLPIFEYDSKVEGSRKETVLKASEADGIRFSVGGEQSRFSPAVQREMDSIKAAAQADGTFMKAPNGKATNLSEEQWLLVRTPNFLRYFGDWINDPASASKILDNNGEPAVVFHGSNWNPLDEQPGEAVFDDSFRGTGSGDNGFFGRGFYFTYQDGSYATAKQAKAEANYYGGNITEAFLDIRNPFMFNETLYQFNGKSNLGSEKESVAIVNMVKNFPGLVKDYRVEVVDSEGNVSGEITLAEYAKIFEDTYNNKEFIVKEGREEWDKNTVELCADPVHHEELINGHKIEWDDYGFRMPMYKPGRNEDAQLAYTHYYLTYLNDMWREDHTGVAYNFPSRMFGELFESEEFTQALKDKGYDGVLQSASGDEAVAFQPEQIKSATAGNGEFTESKDIRFSIADFKPIRADQTQTKAFKDWFKGSKIVNEDGSPMVVYRGAPFDPLAQEPGMGVIKPQAYFSPSEEYADRYYRDNGATRAYYLNIKHPFDIRNKKDRDLWLSMNPDWYKIPETFTGALDWAEFATRIDIDEFIEEHPEYDGVVLDEGGDPDGKGGVVQRGVSFMPFKGGTQVKSATDNNGEFSQTNPDVRFSVKRYRDFATAQQAQKLPGTEYPTDQQMVRFSLSNRNRTTISAWLRKRKDLTDDQRKVVVDYLDELSNPKLQLATARWFAQGVIRLPEDMPKVEQAVAVADRAKVDPLQYGSPMELIEAHADIEIKEKPINPDKVSTLHRAKELPDYGIVVYDVDDTEESRENMRQIINTHYGKEASPWCLLQGDGNGKLTSASRQYWRSYNAYPKQVAFRNGKLLAFSANDSSKRVWWDRQDAPHEGFPLDMPMPNDELKRTATYTLNPETGKLSEPYNKRKGNKQNGTYEEWNELDVLTTRRHYKNGRMDGVQETFWAGGETMLRETCKDGLTVGKYTTWYANGQIQRDYNYDEHNLADGEQREYNADGSLAYRCNYVHGKKDGLEERWNTQGQLISRTGYKEGKRHGTQETWNDHGQPQSYIEYKEGKREGLNKVWHWNGVLAREAHYHDDIVTGDQKTWYESGNLNRHFHFDEDGSLHGVQEGYFDFVGREVLAERWHYEHGSKEGLHETWYDEGKPKLRENYVNDVKEGLALKWFENGLLSETETFRNGKSNGVKEMFDSGGHLWYRHEMVDGKEGRFLGNMPQESVYGDVRFSVVTDKAELDRLEKEPTVTLYRAMELIDGELYPPMSQKVPNAPEDKGKRLKKREGVKPGMWQKSDEDPGKAYQKETGGPWYYDLKKIDKDQSDTNGVLYNPYLHLSASPLNDQFSAAYNRPNLVTVACEVPVSEFTSGYKAEKAADPVGPKDWHSGTVTAQLGEGRQVVLSRWAKIGRIVPDSEVASIMAPKLVAKDITVPANVVTPSLRAALEARGVKFAEPESEEEGVRFSVTGQIQDEDGKVTRFSSEGGLPAGTKRQTLVERTYRKTGAFSFTGKDRIESAGDVAYIFKELETAAVENSFVVYVKNGVPTILHTGIGNIDSVGVDEAAFAAGLKDFAPDEVYMVHNHPSGRVEASRADVSLLEVLQRMAGKVPVSGVIIDTTTGEYGLFDHDTFPSTLIDNRSKENEGNFPLDVQAFDKMVFTPEYRANISVAGIKGPEDIASYLSAHRLGDGQKVGALLLDIGNRVVGNVVLNDNIITNDNASTLAGQIVDAAVHSAAQHTVLFGDFSFTVLAIAKFRSGLASASGGKVSLTDVVRIEGNHTRAMSNETLSDSAGENVRFSVANRNQEVFISNAAKAAQEIKMEKATPEQWIKMLEKGGGLKAGEDKWIGLSDWIKASDKATLSKKEIVDYINEHQIQIEEVHYSDFDNGEALKDLQEEFDTIPFDSSEYMWEEADRRVADFYSEMEEKYGEDFEDSMNPSERITENTLLDERERWDSEHAPSDNEAAFNAMVEKYGDDFEIAFGQNGGQLYVRNGEAAETFLGMRPADDTRLNYTTEGLDNKREIALTVPTIEPWNQYDEMHFGDAGEGRAVAWIRFGDAEAYAYNSDAAQDLRKLMKVYEDQIAQAKAAIDRGVTGKRLADEQDNLRRAERNRRHLADAQPELLEAPKKVLVIDEIQSKRHQEGREHGYNAAQEALDKYGLRVEDGSSYDPKIFNSNGDRLTRNELKVGDDYQGHKFVLATPEEWQAVMDYRALIAQGKNIPAAPFEKNWHELAMKRMLRLAAEEGYDYVAWTTGEQQANRYDLSNKIGNIYITKSSAASDLYDVRTFTVDEDILTDASGSMTEEQMREVFGKDLSARLINEANKDAGKQAVINGDGLRIGGEGMKGFYDEILPRFMNKYGKKWGVKVEDISLPDLEESAQTMHAVPVTQEMKESVMQGQVMFSVRAADEVRSEGISAVVGRENVGDFYMELYRALPADMRKEVADRAMGNGLNVRSAMQDYISEAATKDEDGTGLLRMAETLLNDYAEGELDEATSRYALWRGGRGVNDDDLLDVAHDQFMRNHVGVGQPSENSGQSEVRFSVGDEVKAADAATEAAVDEANEAMKAGRKEIRDLLTMAKAMGLQKEYDKKTVEAVTNLAKQLLKDQYVDALSRREVSRLLGIVRTSVGRSSKMVKKNADAIVEIVIDNLLRREREGLKKLTSTTGTKTNATGVEVLGALDVQGQKTMKAFKEGLKLDVGKVDDSDEANTLYGMRARLQSRLSSKDDAVRKEAEAEDAGLALAIEYKEGIKALEDEEKSLQDDLKDAAAALKDGDLSKTNYDEFVRATEDSMRENHIEQVESLRAFRRKMQEVFSGSAEAKKTFMEREKERVEAIHHLANSDMQGRSASKEKRPGFWDKVANSAIVRFFAAPLATFDQMLRLFGEKSINGEGYLYNKFMRGWLEASERAYIGQRDAKAELDRKASEVFGREMIWSDIYDEVRKMPTVTVKWWDDGKMTEHELSQGQLLYIYMVNKMADGRMKLRKMGIDEEHVEAIRAQMDERFLKLADWLQDEYLVNLRNKYNAIHERLFGASMAAIENYFPLKINKRDLNRNEDLSAPDYESLPSTTTGSIIKRRRNSKALDLLNADAFSVVIEHIDQMEQWAAFAEFNKDVNALLSYKRFRNQVQNMSSVYGSGTTLWNNFKDVCRIAGNAYHPQVGRNQLDSAAVNLAKGVTSAKISFRVYTALKQFLSMPAFVADANIGYLAKNMATPWKAWNWAMENLPVFEKRWKSRIAGDTRLMSTDADWKFFRTKVYDELSRLGMTPNAFVDAVTVAIGARSMYETRYARYIKEGFSEEQADKKAKQDATVLYNETQQSNENAFLSTAQLDRTVFATAITVFRNSSMGFQRQVHDALRNIGKHLRKGYKEQSLEFMTKQLVREGLSEEQAAAAAERRYNRSLMRDSVRLATFGFLVEFAWNLGGSIAYLLFGDDDDEKEKMLAEAFKHALIGGSMEGLAGGNVMSEALNMVAKGENLRNYDPTLLPILSDMKRIYAMMGYDWVAGTNELVNLAVQAGIGVNPQTLSDAVVAVMDACNGDMETSREAMLLIMRVLQVPQSQVDQIYIDELGTNAAGAKRMSPKQMAKRYADYKLKRSAPLTGGLYSDELKDKRRKAYEKSFNKKVKERKDKK